MGLWPWDLQGLFHRDSFGLSPGPDKSQGLTFPRVRIGLGPCEFQAGLTFVALSHVKSLTDFLLIGPVDFSRVRKLGGQKLEERRRDHIRRYPINVTLQ